MRYENGGVIFFSNPSSSKSLHLARKSFPDDMRVEKCKSSSSHPRRISTKAPCRRRDFGDLGEDLLDDFTETPAQVP
jgi:hypothetical protein